VSNPARALARRRRLPTGGALGVDVPRVLDVVGDGVVLMDADGTIVCWNAAAARLTGVRASEAIGRPCREVLDVAADVCERLVGDGAAMRRIGLIHRDGDGSEVRGELRGERVGDTIVLVVRDATAAAAIDQIKADFIATASHELRTPVTSIFGAAATLGRRLRLRGEDLELLSSLEAEAGRLWEVVERLLAAHTARLRELRLHLEPVDAVAICRAAQQLTIASEHGCRLELESENPTCPTLAEPHALHRAVCALLDNAVKYAGPDGQIRLSVVREEPRVRICVEDDGIGLEPAWRERVFEPFVRVDPDMSHGIGGIGLSLFVVHEQVEQMGGEVRVGEAPAGGCAFTLDLAAAPFESLAA